MVASILPAITTDVLLLLIRIIIAVTFVVSARNKLRNIPKFSSENGMPVPVSYFIAVAEIAAAVGMATGVLAAWAGVGLLLLMLGTMSLHIFKWHSPYWASKGGWEYDLMLFALAGVIALFGPGAFAIMLF